jgi:hypothetical protein
MHREHSVGEGDCYRVLVKKEKEPIPDGVHEELNCPMWLVDGSRITDFTLRQQRMYSQHEDGQWSKVRGHSSSNSLPDET